jgi:hypothetical protein
MYVMRYQNYQAGLLKNMIIVMKKAYFGSEQARLAKS